MRANSTFRDPPQMPGSGLPPERVYADALSLSGTPGAAYVERRGVPAGIAARFGVRFRPSFAGRPAVVVALHDLNGTVTSIHGRYLHTSRGQGKMLTVGPGGGAILGNDAWQTRPVILVEGLFDALSLSVCGWDAIATIGRKVPWLSQVAAGRTVWVAFDNGRPGEANVRLYRDLLQGADVRRLPPPHNCKDWNTALVKVGARAVAKWVTDRVTC